MLRNLKRRYEKGDLHYIPLSCDQKKEKEKDPPFQKPKSKGWDTWEEKTVSQSSRRAEGVAPISVNLTVD
jgi:hypothetical protein